MGPQQNSPFSWVSNKEQEELCVDCPPICQINDTILEMQTHILRLKNNESLNDQELEQMTQKKADLRNQGIQ